MAHLLSYLSSLFGSEQCSDCKVTFCVCDDGEDPYAPNKRLKTNAGSAVAALPHAGSPISMAAAGSAAVTAAIAAAAVQEVHLPAHLVLLCGGSPRFAALAERWMHEGGGGSGGAKPQLRIPLDTAEDVPYAKAALQYIYTGQLAAASSYDTAALLHLWRVASYLQIEGCVAACVAALAARLSGGAASGAAAPPAPPYTVIAELYGCRALLPDPASDPRAASLLAACRAELTTRGSAVLGLASDEAALSEVLVWLFPDAPSVLSDAKVLQHALALNPQFLDALLASDAFATDDEASVLLLLIHWLHANHSAAAVAAAATGSARGNWAAALLRRVRLVQMNPTYLYDILDKLLVSAAAPVAWLPYILSRREHLLLCQFAAEAAASDGRRSAMAAAVKAAGEPYDCTSPWYSAVPRARRGAGVPYEWYIPLAELTRALTGRSHAIVLRAAWRNAERSLVSEGLVWYPTLLYKRKATTAHLILRSAMPAVLNAAGVKDVVGVAAVAARLTVRRRGVGGGGGDAAMAAAEPLSCEVRKDDVGPGMASRSIALPLALMGGGGGDGGDGAAAGKRLLLAPWAAYLQRDQTISGTVALL